MREWPNFKERFTDAHKELQQERNTRQAGYHEANQTALMQEYAQATADSIQNLANATAVDQESMNGVIASNKDLVARLDAQMQLIQQLQSQVQAQRAPSNNQRPPTRDIPKENYCHLHGYSKNPNHNSKNMQQEETWTPRWRHARKMHGRFHI